MEENTTHLYLHTKKGTSEVFYVGIGNAKRPYYKGKKRNKFWKSIVSKYGYEITILADNLTWTQACDMEIYLIGYYGRRDLGTGTLVNHTDGGDGTTGYIMSAEEKAKIGAGNKGKIRSASAKARYKAAATGQQRNVKLTEDQVIEILRELRDNPYFGQGADLGRKYGVSYATISDIKRNRTWTHICRDTLKRVITKVLITAQ